MLLKHVWTRVSEPGKWIIDFSAILFFHAGVGVVGDVLMPLYYDMEVGNGKFSCTGLAARVGDNGTSTRRIAASRGVWRERGWSKVGSEVYLALRLMEFYDKIILNFHEIAPVWIKWHCSQNYLESSNIPSREMMINLASMCCEQQSGVRNDPILWECFLRIRRASFA